MGTTNALTRYIGNEFVGAGRKGLAKAGSKAGSKSVLSSLVPSVASEVGDDIASKAGSNMANQGVLNSLVPIRSNWVGEGDIEGMLNGKFLGTNQNYFDNTFARGALGRATYGPEQVVDRNKVAGLVRAIKNNEDIAPIAGFKNDDGLIDIFDGHHRLAAYQKAGKMPRVKLFDRATRDDAYAFADEWAKNAVKKVQQYLPAKPEAGLDEYGMGAIDLRHLNEPKVSQSLELSPEQQEFFKDSVIRDNSGMLKKMYHGSPNGKIKEFNPGSYFTENKEYADGYQNPEASSLMPGARKIKNTPKTYEVYLNIKKPFTLSDAKAKDIYFNEYIKGGNSAYYDPYGTTRKMIDGLDEVDWTEGVNLMEWLQENHPEYDGMYLDEGGTGGYSPDNEYVDRGKSVVNFRGDQVKILN